MKNWKLPLVMDSDSKPSVTVTFTYIAFILCLGVVYHLASKDALSGAIAGLVLFFGCLFLYRLRSLDKVKINLSEKSIELSDEPDTKDEK